MTTDPGERLFEQYVATRGYEILAHEPDLGMGKRPDYLVRAAGHDIVAEVKSFDGEAAPPVASPSGALRGPDLRPIRRKITVAAEQLKGIVGYPLVVVLANPRRLPVPLAHDQVVAAMYGDQVVTFDEAGRLSWRTGRNGRLHVDEPDGSVRGNHPHLSAVAVLSTAHAEDAFAAAWLQEHEGEYPNPLVGYIDAVTHAKAADMTGDALSLNIYETVSTSAACLPRTIFTGLGDTRWGKLAEGRYGRL